MPFGAKVNGGTTATRATTDDGPLPLIAADDPLAVRWFTRILMGNLDILVRAFHDLQQNGTDRRVALALLRLAPAAEVPVPVSQADLGQMAHATRGQVNAVDAGWVGKRYRSVRILDLPALRAFATRET